MEFIQIAATAFQVIGALSSSSSKAEQYEGAAQANEYNAAVARQKADTVTAQASVREDDQRRKARLLAGERRASIAQSGLGFGGSNADVEHQSQLFAELDALNIRYEGALEANAYLDQASLQGHEAGVNRGAASTVKRSGWLGAAGAALSGAGDYVRGTTQRKNPGTGGGSAPAPSLYGLYGGYGTVG